MKSISLLHLISLAGTPLTAAFSPTARFLPQNSLHQHISTTSTTSTRNDLLRLSATPEENDRQPFMDRNQFLTASLTTVSAGIISNFVPLPANAAYGTSSNIALPSYIEFLIEKNTSADTSKSIYKGADTEVQIKRISEAAMRLNEIPAIAKEKKWSQVQGILTGPLGTLLQTMNGLVKDSSNSEAAKKAMGKFKADILLIGQEASKKSEGGVVKACEEAQKDLEAFAKVVF